MRTLGFLLLLALIRAAAADGPPNFRGDSPSHKARFRSGADMVLINASAYDRNGRLVTDLRSEQVRLFDEGVQRQVTAFSFEDVPVSAAVVLDASSSMKRTLPEIRAALSHLSSAAKPEDEFLLITVRDEAVEAVPFTRDLARIERTVAEQQPSGKTAVVDALMLAFRKVGQGRNARKAILVLSDGTDTNSRFNWSELRNVARESTAPMYVFLMRGVTEDEMDDAFRLKQIAEETGGRCVYVGRSSEFPDKLRDLEIHKQYVIGFAPPMPTAVPKYHRVHLKLQESTLRLYWRRGYYR